MVPYTKDETGPAGRHLSALKSVTSHNYLWSSFMTIICFFLIGGHFIYNPQSGSFAAVSSWRQSTAATSRGRLRSRPYDLDRRWAGRLGMGSRYLLLRSSYNASEGGGGAREGEAIFLLSLLGPTVCRGSENICEC